MNDPLRRKQTFPPSPKGRFGAGPQVAAKSTGESIERKPVQSTQQQQGQQAVQEGVVEKQQS